MTDKVKWRDAKELRIRISEMEAEILRLRAEVDAGLIREKDANARAMQHLRRAEKAEIASRNHVTFSYEWRERAEKAEAERDALQAKLDEAEANINLKADFIEATLNDCADLTQQLDEAQAGRVKVRELRWDKHPDEDAFYGGGQDNLVGVNEYNIFPHPCAVGLFVLDVMGNRTEDDFTSVEAAKAAAQADYERRILAAIDMQPLTDQQAARRLLESIPSPLFGELKQYLIGEFHVDYVSLDENGDEVNCVIGVPWTEVKAIIRAALTAIAEANGREGQQ